ncbi:MAG: uroporphyrinogen decarboxylase family protein [Verrucomicrobiota bacterium]
MMTSRERVKKAIHFEGPDHVPHRLPDDKEDDLIWLWMDRPAPIRDWYSYDEDTDRMTDCWGTTFYRAAGGKLGRGEVFEPAIKDIEKQAEYVLPDMNNPKYFERSRKRIEENNASDNPKYCLAVMPFSSLNEGTHNLMGLEEMFMAYYESPDDLKAFVARLAENQRESIRKCAEIGCDGVMGYDDWGLQDNLMVSQDLIEEFFMPHYRKNWALAHELGMDVWLHSCGQIMDILPKFIDAGLTVIQQDQQENMGLETLSERFGGKLAFWCPVDIQRTMIEGSLEDIDQYVKRMVETLGSHNGGLVSMAYSTPADIGHTPEKLEAMSKAFRKYGVYKN